MPEQIITKRCSKCKHFKPLSGFYKDKSTKAGYAHWCKKCQKFYNQSQQGKIRMKRYKQTEKGKIANKHYEQGKTGKATKKRYRAKHSEREKAKNKVHNTIRAGKLCGPKTLACYYCPKPAEQYHHWRGYDKKHWLDVVPVCKNCHRNIHNL